MIIWIYFNILDIIELQYLYTNITLSTCYHKSLKTKYIHTIQQNLKHIRESWAKCIFLEKNTV